MLGLLLGWGFPLPAALLAQPAPVAPAVALELITDQLEEPVFVTHAGDGSRRLFVVEKKGRIVIVRDGVPRPMPFLDIRSRIEIDQIEQGLLSVAFHPQYASNGLFYVHYTPRPAEVIVARYQVSADDPDVADPDSEVVLFDVKKPANRHHGGLVVFGPDGYLYIALGDGSRCGDCQGNAQRKSSLLGKLLRVDVDGGSPYAIPPDNPFVDEPGARPEVWAYGLRNPWRFSFDRATGDLYIADPGYERWDEVNFQRAGTGGGRNYGWNKLEGRHCFPPDSRCNAAGFEQPIVEYGRSLGCAVVGGHVYRGPSFPELTGWYFYGDFCSGRIWALREEEPGTWREQELLKTPLSITSFGEDQPGELYVTSLSGNGLYRLVVAP